MLKNKCILDGFHLIPEEEVSSLKTKELSSSYVVVGARASLGIFLRRSGELVAH